jgi:hypothetical protein
MTDTPQLEGHVEMARLNITYQGQNGDLPDMIQYDLDDDNIRAMAAEAVQGGDVPGIGAYPSARFTDFKVDRFPATDEVQHNRLFLRPKTTFAR